jgi:2-hydroxychromene-2-carboxylate isomerase
MRKIEFFFDYLSPYSFLAWNMVKKNIKVLKGHGELIYTPVILSQVIHANDTKGPAEIKSKRDYLMKNCLRYSSKHNIDFNIPKTLPFNSLEALRLSQFKLMGDRQAEFIDMCFKFSWGEGHDLGDLDSFEKLYLANNFNIESMLAELPMKELRRELKSSVKRAIELEVFGLPTFLIQENNDKKEMFWGCDSMEDLLSFLQGEDILETPSNKIKYAKYETLF